MFSHPFSPRRGWWFRPSDFALAPWRGCAPFFALREVGRIRPAAAPFGHVRARRMREAVLWRMRAEGPTCFSARRRPGVWRAFRVSALQGQQEHKVCVAFALSGRIRNAARPVPACGGVHGQDMPFPPLWGVFGMSPPVRACAEGNPVIRSLGH